MSRPVDRRRLLAGAARAGTLLALGGFHPLYGQGGDMADAAGTGSGLLGQIFVDVIPERVGQLLRQSLQQVFEGSGAPDRKRYELQVLLAFTQEAVNILPDNSASRLRYSGVASFVLKDQDHNDVLVMTGGARAVDAANVIDNQPFASDLETDTISRRMMQALARQIAQRIAAHFRRHPPSP